MFVQDQTSHVHGNGVITCINQKSQNSLLCKSFKVQFLVYNVLNSICRNGHEFPNWRLLYNVERKKKNEGDLENRSLFRWGYMLIYREFEP